VWNRPVSPATLPALFRAPRANRIALGAQIVFGLCLAAMFANLSLRFSAADGGPGAPRSPLRGIWAVERMAVDGDERPPMQNDYARQWRRVIFDFTDRMYFQRWDDSYAAYGVSVDQARRTLALTKGMSRNWRASFAFERPARDRLILDGAMDGSRIRAELQLVEPDTFRLLNSDFRWVRPAQ
jgi:hypothetical protein